MDDIFNVFDKFCWPMFCEMAHLLLRVKDCTTVLLVMYLMEKEKPTHGHDMRI